MAVGFMDEVSTSCPKPEPKLAVIYQALKLKPVPFVRKKSVVFKIAPEHYKRFVYIGREPYFAPDLKLNDN